MIVTLTLCYGDRISVISVLCLAMGLYTDCQSRTINFAQARHNFNVFYITSGILPNDKAEASGIALSVGGGYLFTRAKSVKKMAEDTVKKSLPEQREIN